MLVLVKLQAVRHPGEMGSKVSVGATALTCVQREPSVAQALWVLTTPGSAGRGGVGQLCPWGAHL